MDQARVNKDPMIGRMLLGRYRIVRELAKGGMGVVYLARAEGAVGFVKPVVVKLILQEFAEDQRYMGMFAREAEILANLRDPSIVDVLEFGEEDGNYVMVLEYVRGYHLGQWKRYLRRIDRVVPTEAAIQIAIDVLQALHHAHTARHPDGESMYIVHRDVSPSNILLDGNGRARLLDFGVARMRGGSHGYKTQVKGFVGKDQYIAPEIFAGADASPQSDLYACGVVLHETLLGQNVFRARTQAATLNRVLNHVAEPVASVRFDVPAGLDAALAMALAKEPAERFGTAAEFAEALRALLTRPEHLVREELAAMLAQDFTDEMARSLGIESLTARDEAWRRLSVTPAAGTPLRRSGPPTVARPDGPRGAPGAQARAAGHEDKTRVSHEGEDVTVVSSVDLVSEAGVPDPRVSRSDSPPTVVSEAGAALPAVPAPARLPSTAPPPPPATGVGVPPPPAASVAGLASPPVPGTPVAAPRQSRLMVYGLIGVALLAVASIALSLLGGRGSVAPSPSIRVVQQPLPSPGPPGSDGTKETDGPEPPEPAAAEGAKPDEGTEDDPPAVVEPEVETPPASDAPAVRRKAAPRRRAARTGPDLASLTRAFRRRQTDVRRCLEQQGSSLGQARMQVEFRLSGDGRVQHARVRPPSLAKTEVGQCVQRVAEKTRFPGQGEPVEFAIPVTARLVK